MPRAVRLINKIVFHTTVYYHIFGTVFTVFISNEYS